MTTGFALALGVCSLLPAFTATGNTPQFKLRALKTGAIKLTPGRLKDAFEKNSEYLKSLDSDMLLYAYRFFAYLKTPGRPSGGWEYPLNPNRGTILGHWLSAAAQSYAHTGDQELLKKAKEIVADLRRIQLVYGTGWVQASGPERLLVFEGKHRGDPDFSVITAPYYVVHKILVGLLDMYNLTGDEMSLTVARDFGNFIKKETDSLTNEHLQKMLEREHGGVEEAFYYLAQTTGDKSFAKLGKRFEHLAFTTPLKHREDKLTDIHVNTQLPKLVGEAVRWEVFGEKDAKDLVEYAWETIENTRTYATGGTSSKEYWRKPRRLTETLCTDTQESCTSYNWEKLTKHLLEWSADAKYGDAIERIMFNGIMPAQNPRTGMFIYFLPLTTTGAAKKWGSPTEDFWCCYGTMMESFSTLADNAYFAGDSALAINLYVPSKADWNGVTVSQKADFPASDTSTITVETQKETAFDLLLRIPAWCEAPVVEVNGAPIAGPVAGSFFKVARTWKTGDQVTVRLPRKLHLDQLGDDPHTLAVMYGPIVLGAVSDKAVQLPDGDPATWLKKEGDSLVFHGAGVTFKPLFDMIDETYCAYFTRS